LPNSGVKATPANVTTVARAAERLGFHSLWVTDRILVPRSVSSHYPYGTGGHWAPSTGANIDPLLTLAWAAAAAPSLKVGTSVLLAPLRHPVLLAKELASLDYLTGGRVILGLGVGWMQEEFGALGVPFDDRGRRAEEAVAVMRALWSGESVDVAGPRWKASGLRVLPRPAQATIPVYWGGHSDAALKRVARLGDGWHPTRITMEELTDGLRRLRAFWVEAGRDLASLPVIVRPGITYAIDAKTHAQHVALGIRHLIIDTPVDDPSLDRVLDDMHRVAELCGLRPRA
jgi:probable F420-dependent oxidoreductase